MPHDFLRILGYDDLNNLRTQLSLPEFKVYAQSIFRKRKLFETARFFFLKIQDNYDCVTSQIPNFSFHDFPGNEDQENTKVTSPVTSARDPEPDPSPHR